MRSELESLRVKKVKHSFPICPVAFKASPLASRTLPTRSVETLLQYFVMVGSGGIVFFNFFAQKCHSDVLSKLKIHLKNGMWMQV